MAGDAINTALITQFSADVHLQAQQSQARLRSAVKIKPMTGDDFAYDGIGIVEASEQAARHQPVVFSDIDHTRRKITRRRFVLTLPIDAHDVRGMLLNPQGEYAAACGRAMERVFDRVVIESLFAAVLTGRAMGTSVSFASDGGQTVTATAGLTYEKLLEARQNFIDKEVGNEAKEDFVFGISGDEHTALMKENELTNGDFSRQYVVDQGEITRAAGFSIVLFGGTVNNPLLTVSGGVRDNFIMSKRGICVGMSKEMGLKVEPRPDLVETTQVQITFDLGAVRTEGLLVQKLTTTD